MFEELGPSAITPPDSPRQASATISYLYVVVFAVAHSGFGGANSDLWSADALQEGEAGPSKESALDSALRRSAELRNSQQAQQAPLVDASLESNVVVTRHGRGRDGDINLNDTDSESGA